MSDEYSGELHQYEPKFTGKPNATSLMPIAYTQLLSTFQLVSFMSCNMGMPYSSDEQTVGAVLLPSLHATVVQFSGSHLATKALYWTQLTFPV